MQCTTMYIFKYYRGLCRKYCFSGMSCTMQNNLHHSLKLTRDSPTSKAVNVKVCAGELSTYQFSFFHKFTTLIIHTSFTLSLPAQNLPLSQILPTIGPHSFPRTDTTDSGRSPFIAYPVLFWFHAVD